MTLQVLGLCYEGTDNTRPGAALGPAYMRWGLEACEIFSPWQNREMPHVVDYGDRYFLPFEPDAAVEQMRQTLTETLDPQSPFLILGGDHLVTLPVVQWCWNTTNEPFWIVHFDAHLDQREYHHGIAHSHATVMRRVDETLGNRVVTFGFRSRGSEEHFNSACHFGPDLVAPLARWLEGPGQDGPIYLSLDVDVLDPSLMPYVSNAEPGGTSFPDLIDALRLLRGRLIGADLVELVALEADATAAELGGILMRELAIALT